MKIAVLTIFPEMIDQMCSWGILGRAREKGLLEIQVFQLRQFTHDAHRTTDDYVYGGGGGMVMKAAPVFEFFDFYKTHNPEFKVIFPSPQGRLFDSDIARELSEEKSLVFICGRYEGIDERVMSVVDYELSVGSFVVSGGEIPCLLMIDGISRFIPEVVGNARSVIGDSFYEGLLDHANWTRPQAVRGMEVPITYCNGNHEAIELARRKDSIIRTIEKRPDLFLKKEFDLQDKKAIVEIVKELTQDAG